ncbi:hypothetical protein CW304_13360 [Bacillus sp. UFRGS-B20]|nr:hypothetical protein CW304_13360 [Bacillus sp. UFRGS-B20]
MGQQWLFGPPHKFFKEVHHFPFSTHFLNSSVPIIRFGNALEVVFRVHRTSSTARPSSSEPCASPFSASRSTLLRFSYCFIVNEFACLIVFALKRHVRHGYKFLYLPPRQRELYKMPVLLVPLVIVYVSNILKVLSAQ